VLEFCILGSASFPFTEKREYLTFCGDFGDQEGNETILVEGSTTSIISLKIK
jgi:hypothetical protein